jgi:hypothetical protein
MESRQFRNLLLYLHQDLGDDIPHCTMVRSAVIDAWHTWFIELKQDLRVNVNAKLSNLCSLNLNFRGPLVQFPLQWIFGRCVIDLRTSVLLVTTWVTAIMFLKKVSSSSMCSLHFTPSMGDTPVHLSFMQSPFLLISVN